MYISKKVYKNIFFGRILELSVIYSLYRLLKFKNINICYYGFKCGSFPDIVLELNSKVIFIEAKNWNKLNRLSINKVKELILKRFEDLKLIYEDKKIEYCLICNKNMISKKILSFLESKNIKVFLLDNQLKKISILKNFVEFIKNEFLLIQIYTYKNIKNNFVYRQSPALEVPSLACISTFISLSLTQSLKEFMQSLGI